MVDMKKHSCFPVFAAMILTACFVSCEKDVSVNDSDGRIVFSMPQMTVETRSTTKDAFEVGDEFGVIGYCVPYMIRTLNPNYNAGSDIWALKKKLCPPDVFYMQKVKVGANGCTYDRAGGDSNDPKYWYRDGYDTGNNPNGNVAGADGFNYTFFAYYPYDGCFDLELSKYYPKPDEPDFRETGAPIFTFTMPQEGNDVNNTKLDHTVTPDAMLSVLYDRKQSDGNLRFNFSHLLTALGFEVNNFSEYDLTVHSIKLAGSFYKQIRIDLTGSQAVYTFPESRYKGYYSIFDGEGLEGGGYTLKAPDLSKGETVTSSPSPIGPVLDGSARNEFIMLISGTGTSFGDNVKVYIDYTFGNQPRETRELMRPGTFKPSPGKKYTAQLNFVGNAFVINFVVSNNGEWENGSAADDNNTGNDDIVFE